MGWIAGKMTRAQLCAELDQLSDRYTLLGKAWGGGCYWQAIERKADGVKLIVCNLVESSGGELSYKTMDESMGPCYYDVPASILALVPTPPPGGYAAEWREKVAARQAAKKERATLAAGSVVEYGGHTYRLVQPAGPRRGWDVVRVADGCHFRMKSGQLADATILPAA